MSDENNQNQNDNADATTGVSPEGMRFTPEQEAAMEKLEARKQILEELNNLNDELPYKEFKAEQNRLYSELTDLLDPLPQATLDRVIGTTKRGQTHPLKLLEPGKLTDGSHDYMLSASQSEAIKSAKKLRKEWISQSATQASLEDAGVACLRHSGTRVSEFKLDIKSRNGWYDSQLLIGIKGVGNAMADGALDNIDQEFAPRR